jgi:hypothetical protein
MLDSGCSMLDDLNTIYSGNEVHPVSSNQYQKPANSSRVFLETAYANCQFYIARRSIMSSVAKPPPSDHFDLLAGYTTDR